MAPLRNPRRENFCLLYVTGIGATEAYKRAFKTSSLSAASSNASRLTRNPAVEQRIKELQTNVAEVIVKETGLRDADVIAELMKIGFAVFDPKAITIRDKIAALKILEERTRLVAKEGERQSKQVGFIDAPPRETYEQWFARRQRELDRGEDVKAIRDDRGKILAPHNSNGNVLDLERSDR